MTLVVFGSARSSPGVTTLALATASWLSHGLVVEADPDGGVLALRYGLGREPGLVTLAAARTAGAGDLLAHAQRLPGGLPVLVAHESPERATHLWRTAGDSLVRALAGQTDLVAVADAGRLGPSSPALALAAHASLVAIVARPTAEELLAAAERAATLAAANHQVTLVLAGPGPYTPREVVDQLGCDVLGVIPDDRRGARALASGGSRRLVGRSALMRSARALAEELAARLDLTPGVRGRPARGSSEAPSEVGT